MPKLSDRISDRWAARVRTVWPVIVGAAAATLLTHAAPVVDLLTGWGVPVDEPLAKLVVGAALAWLVWDVGTWLERRQGDGRAARVARAVGRWLVSLGLHTGPASYAGPPR